MKEKLPVKHKVVELQFSDQKVREIYDIKT